ncbi:MAG: homocysteine S-methyltransferase family protein, partial [Streptomyces sp.]|nr:homocysteine S-methyltransferase family protein [Streptomyces sp.]
GGRGWRGPVTFSAELVPEWRTAGARLIGGCCRVGPGTIGSVARALARPPVS